MPARGLQYIPLRIPDKWDPVWFEGFIRDVLGPADVRNAIPGTGIEITGQPDAPATISSSEDLQQLKDQSYLLADTPDPGLIPNARIFDASAEFDVADDGPGGNLTIALATHGVSFTKLRQAAAFSVLGNPTNAAADHIGIVASANDRVLRRVSDALDFGQLTVGMAPNDVWTYAKLQNVSATSRILGRKSASAGDIEECTLSDVLDFIGSAAQGDILYRDSSGWARLAAGTSGRFLQTQGTGANPVWAAGGSGPLSFISDTTVAGSAATNITVSGLDIDTDKGYMVQIALAGAAAGAATLNIFFNADTTAANYRRSINGTPGSNAAFAGLDNGQPGLWTGYLRRCPVTGRIIFTTQGGRFVSTGSLDYSSTVIWQTSANLTSFTVNSSVANQIAIGSSVRLWRLGT